MKISVILSDFEGNIVDKTDFEAIKKNCFSYIDADGNKCEVVLKDNSLLLKKFGKEYYLELDLNNKNYALIRTAEGEIKLDVKVVDFLTSVDVLLWRYQIDNEERKIEIVYRG